MTEFKILSRTIVDIVVIATCHSQAALALSSYGKVKEIQVVTEPEIHNIQVDHY
jgi:hypothetical protein